MHAYHTKQHVQEEMVFGAHLSLRVFLIITPRVEFFCAILRDNRPLLASTSSASLWCHGGDGDTILSTSYEQLQKYGSNDMISRLQCVASTGGTVPFLESMQCTNLKSLEYFGNPSCAVVGMMPADLSTGNGRLYH
jgi:hypothetical protein